MHRVTIKSTMPSVQEVYFAECHYGECRGTYLMQGTFN
jgi:hypothetical protein